MEEKILNFILECAEVQKSVPFSLIEEEFNLILDEALKSVITDALWDKILVNNAFKTVQQSAKDKEDICRRADARQKYLTQISHSDGLD